MGSSFVDEEEVQTQKIQQPHLLPGEGQLEVAKAAAAAALVASWQAVGLSELLASAQSPSPPL